MRPLPEPDISSDDMLFASIASERNQIQRQKYIANQAHIQTEAALFDAATDTRSWCTLERALWGNPGAVICGELTKKEMMDLYSNNVVKSTGQARSYYDEIKVAANGKCPFCAGIGHVKNLDHFLPKAFFPQHSVLPHNLVPCCRDCNSDKKASFAIQVEGQGIHPYLDNAHFFEEKWVHASVVQDDPVVLTFQVIAPPHWPEIDQQRVQRHFFEYDLAARFSIEVGPEITSIVDLRRGWFQNMPDNDFREYLRSKANSEAWPINSWQRAMHFALANDDWFVQQHF